MQIVELVIGAKLGNSLDFGRLVGLFEPRLRAWVRRQVRNSHDAEELVQESFLQAWTAIGGLREPQAFPSWLYAIARSKAMNHLRS